MNKNSKINWTIASVIVAILLLFFGPNWIGRSYNYIANSSDNNNKAENHDNKVKKNTELKTVYTKSEKEGQIKDSLINICENKGFFNQRVNLLDRSFDLPESFLSSKEIKLANLEDFVKLKKHIRNENTFFNKLLIGSLKLSEPNTLERFEPIYRYMYDLRLQNGHYSTINSDYKYYEKDNEFAYGRKYFNLSSKNLDTLYNTYSPLIFKIITPGVYLNSRLKIVVDNLISSKIHINSIPKSKRVLNELSSVKLLNSMENIIPIYNEDVITKFQDDQTNCWFFNFWVRRHIENNDEVVFRILKKIQKKYY